MYILIFILVLFVLVLVHEFGHFWTAKKTGMRVDEFGIGFPPRLFGITRGETIYSINALPLGGFVRIFGEDGGEVSENGQTLMDTTRHERSFSGRPKWAQILVLLAGIGANILFAWLLFSVALYHGVLTSVSPAEATSEAQLYVLENLPDGPASRAGIPAGAVVTGLSRGGKTVAPHTPDEFRAFIEASQGMPVVVQYTHNGTEQQKEVTPVRGVLTESPQAVAIGVSLGLAEIRSLPIHRALIEGFLTTLYGMRDIAVGIASFFGSVFMLQANLTAVAGPVGIAGLVGDASALGLSALLMFTAFISLNLAVINVLPFPALDGGRLAFVIIEAIKGSPIPARVSYYTNAIGFVILILLMVAITYHDIVKLV